LRAGTDAAAHQAIVPRVSDDRSPMKNSRGAERTGLPQAYPGIHGDHPPMAPARNSRLSPRYARLVINEAMIRALGIAAPDSKKPVGQLSGGNKVTLARSLASSPAHPDSRRADPRH
jgi:hypothetical protein